MNKKVLNYELYILIKLITNLNKAVMKNLKNTLILISISVLLLTDCTGMKVVSDKDNSVDFSKIRTYKFVGWAGNSSEVLNRFDKQRIEQAFATEAAKRGLSVVETNPDVLVALFKIGELKTRKTSNTTTTGMGMGGIGMGGMGMAYGMLHPGWGWGGGMGMMSQSHTVINESSYIKGTLMIEFFDPDEKKLIWQGIGKKILSEDPKKRAKDIPKKVSAIMTGYPIKPIK